MACYVTVISVGPGDPELMNVKTMEAIRHAAVLFLRTGRHPLSGWLDSLGISYETMDSLYESAEDFDRLFAAVAEKIWQSAAKKGTVVYAVPDAQTDRTVDAVIANQPKGGSVTVVPGFSYADYYLSACRGLFSTADIRIVPASGFVSTPFDPSLPFLLTELNDAITAGEVKTRLSEYLDDEDTVVFLGADGVPHPIPLFELDRQRGYDHLSAVAGGGRSWQQRDAKTLQDLLQIMDLLRSPDGCPWDRAQTHGSLRPYVVEEAWEVVDRIDAKDPVHLAEELGDLLFQIVFHTSIGKNFDEFTMNDVITSITNKMIRRHPHVFGEGRPGRETFSAVKWEELKQSETGGGTVGQSLDEVPASLPSLRRAEKIVRKLERVPSLKRSAEEVKALICSRAEALRNAEDQDSEQLLASLLFGCAELSQRLGLDGEVLLHGAIRNLAASFRDIEANQGQDALKRLTFNDLGVY